jgi:GntR family transcriptional repressor for pyruvate dehydrogenase complex
MPKSTLEFLTPPRKERLSSQIAKQIKKLIFSRKIEMGQRLPSERELAESLNVSRVVVGEALRSLEQRGFIEIRGGSKGGSFVSNEIFKPLFATIYDLLQDGSLSMEHFFEARIAVESFSMEQAMKSVTDEAIDRLELINSRLQHKQKDTRENADINTEFHIAISEISKNPLARLLVGAILQTLMMYIPSISIESRYAKSTYDRHCKIIRAMRKRDLPLCLKAIHEDVEVTKELLSMIA